VPIPDRKVRDIRVADRYRLGHSQSSSLRRQPGPARPVPHFWSFSCDVARAVSRPGLRAATPRLP
jgi:hypothetical protein